MFNTHLNLEELIFILGRAFHCISDTMMVVLLILLGKGWTVTRYCFVSLFFDLNLKDDIIYFQIPRV